MLRFAVVACMMAMAAAGAAEYPSFQNTKTMADRQSIGAMANLGLGDFGSLNAGGNLAVPNGAPTSFLQTAIYGLGAVVLINLLVTVAIPFVTNFLQKPTEEEAKTKDDKKEGARSLFDYASQGEQILNFIQDFAEKYQ